MVSDRKTAKASATEPEDSDPELDAALAAAERVRLDGKKEDNRHKETMNQQNLGIVGKVFGDGKSLPITMAFVALVFGAASSAGCWIAAAGSADVEIAAFWATQAERALGFAGLALGYILGTGRK